MILIYLSEITLRTDYVFRLIFMEILGIKVVFTTSLDGFKQSELPKINYSRQKAGDELFIKSAELLFMKGIESPEPELIEFRGENYFFKSSPDSFLPFDPFAATFFLVTRLEEYLPFSPDQYGRYSHENSILHRHGLLRKPVVNQWAQLIREKIMEKYPTFSFPKPEFGFISTIDIDSAWAYCNKGFIRNLGGLIRDILKGQFREVIQRFLVQGGFKSDPFDTYDFLNETFQGNEDKVIYFFLLGNHSQFDKNINHLNASLRKLILQISGKYRTGIHPSLKGNRDDSEKWLSIEKGRLQTITGKEVKHSRQHFLYLRFPETYRGLINNKIEADFTMGYPGECGFRAGICTPYFWYDLLDERITDLKVYPFQVMDVTFADYLGLNAELAMQTIQMLMTEVKSVGGIFISLWHNESLTNSGKWKGYAEVFTKMNHTGFLWANE